MWYPLHKTNIIKPAIISLTFGLDCFEKAWEDFEFKGAFSDNYARLPNIYKIKHNIWNKYLVKRHYDEWIEEELEHVGELTAIHSSIPYFLSPYASRVF